MCDTLESQQTNQHRCPVGGNVQEFLPCLMHDFISMKRLNLVSCRRLLQRRIIMELTVCCSAVRNQPCPQVFSRVINHRTRMSPAQFFLRVLDRRLIDYIRSNQHNDIHYNRHNNIHLRHPRSRKHTQTQKPRNETSKCPPSAFASVSVESKVEGGIQA